MMVPRSFTKAFGSFVAVALYLLLSPSPFLNFASGFVGSPDASVFRSKLRPLRRTQSRSTCTSHLSQTKKDGSGSRFEENGDGVRLVKKAPPPGGVRWNLSSMLLIEDVKPFVEMRTAAENIDILERGVDMKSFPPRGPVPALVLPYRSFVRSYDYDMGHEGRFTVFGSDGASLHPDVVFCLDDPLSYIANVLSYRGDGNSRYPSTNEAVVFAPGLNTLHECESSPSDRDPPQFRRTSPARVEYYSRVLGDLAMAQIHSGTYSDQGDVDVPLSQSAVEALLSTRHFLNEEERHRARTEHRIRLCANNRDKIRLALSASNRVQVDSGVESTIIKLLDAAAASVREDGKAAKSPHLVLMVYGGSSVDTAAALRTWKDREAKSTSIQEAETLLRKAVTVVTMGSLSRCFPDGPAYVHVSMVDDPLASSFGASSKHPEGGGKDAVYLHAISPYYYNRQSDQSGRETIHDIGFDDTCNDAHNMDACAVQFLAIVMRVNGVRSFRDLFNLASTYIEWDISPKLFALAYSDTDLDIPPNLDEELLPAMIRATKGDRWLWNPHAAFGDGGIDGVDSPIPCEDEADAIVGWQYGYDAYKEIVEACTYTLS